MHRVSLVLLASFVSATAFAAGENAITRDNILALMNGYRAEAGLHPLRADEQLMQAAEDRMRHMEDHAYWSHESPEGLSPFVWILQRNYDYSAAAENLAAGFETAKFLVASWMESPGHRENIMSASYEDCGIAIIDGATTGRATGRSIVVLFGARKSVILAGAKDPPR